MKLHEAYQDILNRAGDGYSDYIDRAREMFWRSLAAIIQKNEFQPSEISPISHHYTTRINVTDFPYQLDHYNDKYHVFGYNVKLDSATSGVVLTPITNDMFMKSSQLLNISLLSGMNEVLWTLESNTIKAAHLNTVPIVDSAKANVDVHLYGIPPEDMTSANDQAECASYMAYSILLRVIEGATAAIIQELRG